MKPEAFVADAPGELVRITPSNGAEFAFVPAPLPPDWEWPHALWPLLMKAREGIARLQGISSTLPDPQIILRPLLRREATQSSNLEGTYTPPRQQALFEIDPATVSEEEAATAGYREIANYGEALKYYFDSPSKPSLNRRLICELHAILLEGVRGSDRTPGAFRREQVFIGRPARFVPPPPYMLQECLEQLERFIVAPQRAIDPLIKAFLVHYQIETIHPFSDGNGRVGRLLLSIMIAEGMGMSDPWLQMSSYFEANRDRYIDSLFRVSTSGDWEGWISFCLQGAVEQAADAESRCRHLHSIRDRYRRLVQESKMSVRLMTVIDNLFVSPAVNARSVELLLNVSAPTAYSDIARLVDAGILVDLPESSHPKAYYSPDIMSVIYD